MGGHRTLEGQRPVHPECPKLDRSNSKCQCDELWGYWDGTDAELDYSINIAERQSKKRRARTSTGAQCTTELDGETTYGGEHPGFSDEEEEPWEGFWKESEHLNSVKQR